jgi:hypothetical protein
MPTVGQQNQQELAVLKERITIYMRIVIFAFLLSWSAIGWLVERHIPNLIDNAVSKHVQPVADNSTFLLENSPTLLHSI